MNNKQPVTTGANGQTSSSAPAKRTDSFTEGGSYEIKVVGQLDAHWSEWLGGLAIAYDNGGNTLLTGIIQDQAALHGILVQIRDLGQEKSE
jgi:hypothetical protein